MRLPSAAAELARSNVDVFFGAGPEAALAALKQVGTDKPIVFVAVDFDPIASGHIVNSAHPGGRLTGITAVQSVLPGKRLELVKGCCRGREKSQFWETTRPLANLPWPRKPPNSSRWSFT